MATTAVVTRGKKIGDVVKQELWAEAGWCRKTIPVTITEGMAVGAVLELTTDSALGTLVVTATAANAVCILIDESVYDQTVADEVELAVLYQGPCIVALNSLSYGTITAAAEVTAEAALTALGMKVSNSVL